MTEKGKITKTEKFLLLLTGAFLLLLLVLHAGVGKAAEGAYVITPEKGGAEEIAVEKINVNTADEETLQQLDGIGPVLARRIVEWREAGGVFTAPEDLLAVNGIGEATLEAIRDFIITEETP